MRQMPRHIIAAIIVIRIQTVTMCILRMIQRRITVGDMPIAVRQMKYMSVMEKHWKRRLEQVFIIAVMMVWMQMDIGFNFFLKAVLQTQRGCVAVIQSGCRWGLINIVRRQRQVSGNGVNGERQVVVLVL